MISSLPSFLPSSHPSYSRKSGVKAIVCWGSILFLICLGHVECWKCKGLRHHLKRRGGERGWGFYLRSAKWNHTQVRRLPHSRSAINPKCKATRIAKALAGWLWRCQPFFNNLIQLQTSKFSSFIWRRSGSITRNLRLKSKFIIILCTSKSPGVKGQIASGAYTE